MKTKSAAGLYVLLGLFAAISMGYYVAGALALRQEFFYAARYAREPFDFGADGQTLNNVQKEAYAAGLRNGDVTLRFNGRPFTGYAQVHQYTRHAVPGDAVEVAVRKLSGAVQTVPVRLAAGEGPDFPLGALIAFVSTLLGVPLFCLLIGYWIVAARPRDLNAWLALVLLTFPETAYGNLDWKFWPALWQWLGLWNFAIQVLVFPALVWFGFLFPERWRVDRRLPWLKPAFLAASVILFVEQLADATLQLYNPHLLSLVVTAKVWLDRLAAALQVMAIVLFLVAIFDKLRSSTTEDARRRLRVLAIGSGLSLGPVLLIFVLVPLLGGDPHHGKWFIGIVPCFALFPLTLAYVVVVQRAMDVRILLRMGTKYLLARATLLLLEIAAVGFLLVRFAVPALRGGQHQALNFTLLAVCLAGLFQVFVRRNSLSGQLQRWLDRRFFREAYNSELVLSELAGEVRHLTEKGALLETVLRRISEVLHVSEAAIFLRGGGGYQLQGALGAEMLGAGMLGSVALPAESATVRHLIATNEPATVYWDRPEEWIADADAEERALLRRTGAELLLPMPGREQLMGLMALGPKRSEEPYTPTDLRTLQSVAAQTGLTLEVAELVRTLASEAAQRERMNREIEIAREVQQRLFPQTIPAIAGVSLAGVCRPALEVGGDYYDLVELENGHLGFAIGDVSGKGISAALIMASLRASLRGLILDEPGDLARMMEKVNRLVYEASSSSRYATFFFATFDPSTRRLNYVNAGHNPPVLLRAASGERAPSGETIERLEASGPVVGLLASVGYEAQSLVLEHGDLLIGYTDGISEAMTAGDEEWGEDRMMAAAPREAEASAAEVVAAIFAAADAFTAGAEQHDDMTLLVMKLV